MLALEGIPKVVSHDPANCVRKPCSFALDVRDNSSEFQHGQHYLALDAMDWDSSSLRCNSSPELHMRFTCNGSCECVECGLLPLRSGYVMVEVPLGDMMMPVPIGLEPAVFQIAMLAAVAAVNDAALPIHVAATATADPS